MALLLAHFRDLTSVDCAAVIPLIYYYFRHFLQLDCSLSAAKELRLKSALAGGFVFFFSELLKV